jgi:SAM-dependent methyltransferase
MKPPKKIPKKLYDKYTMDGAIEVEEKYLDNSSEEIQKEFNDNFTEGRLREYFEKVAKSEPHYYGATDIFLYEALRHFSVCGKHVLIMGSANPWYEAMFLSWGASKITVVEYSDRPSVHPFVEYKKIEDVGDELFDVAVSISSFEHDGLGRYGDPLNPDGDLEAMATVRRILKIGGLFFLSVPIAKDKLVWNAHRVYGSIRLPKLLEGWKCHGAIGFEEKNFEVDMGVNADHQPVWILEA